MTLRFPMLMLLLLLAAALLATACEAKKDDAGAGTKAAGESTGGAGEPSAEADAAEAPAAKLELVDADLATLQAAIQDAGKAGAKAVLVNAWATWCAPCIEEFPDLVKLGRDYADKGLVVLFVSADVADARDDVVEFLNSQGVTGKSFLKAGDEDAFINGLHPEWDGSLPATFVYDASGKQVAALREPASYEKFAALVDPVLAGTAGASAAPVADASPGVTLGESIPEAVAQTPMKSVDGSEVTLAGLPGDKGKLVVFTCNHCPYAQQWAERIAELGNRYAAQGVGVVAINPNDPAAYPDDAFEPMQKEAARLGLKFPYVVDATSDVARAFGATKTPHVYLFDAAGKLVYVGAVDDNSADPKAVTKTWLDDALAALVAGTPIPVAESKAVGCSIKFRAPAAGAETAP